MPKNRIPRVNALIRKEVNQIILRDFDFSGVLVTITQVAVSGNLFEAKIFVSVMPEEKTSRIMVILKKNIYDIQQNLNKRLRMRPVPRIEFVEEKQTKSAGRVEQLLEEIKKNENNLKSE